MGDFMKHEPISLDELFGLNSPEFPEWASRYDLYTDFDVVPDPDPPVEKRTSRSLFSYLRSGCDAVDGAICAIANWFAEGFVTGLALYGCGHALVDSSCIWPLGDPVDERSGPKEPSEITDSSVQG
jgi:hypothetical protein